MVRYDPYTDSFIDNLIKETTATSSLDAFPKNVIQYTVEVSDESIEKIADAVVRKLTDCKTKPTEVSYTKEISTTAKGYSKTVTKPQVFTWGKEVHEFCKMECNKSKARSFDGNGFIVCEQSNDAICISLPACPLGKWIAGKEYHILPMDEPQTDLANDSQVLVKDLVDDEFNPYDEECMRCKHLKLKCEFIPTYCKFESRDEPQTERSSE